MVYADNLTSVHMVIYAHYYPLNCHHPSNEKLKIDFDLTFLKLIRYGIQLLIKNNESGMVLLRLVEVLGEDGLNDVGTETLYFITSALNQLNIDPLRNKILLKILPLKV